MSPPLIKSLWTPLIRLISIAHHLVLLVPLLSPRYPPAYSGHLCPQPCHDKRFKAVEVVLTKTERKKQKLKTNPIALKQQLTPCPPCAAPILRACIGAHTIRSLPCHSHDRFTCTATCGRPLPCQRHFCQVGCHLPLTQAVTWRDQDAVLRAAQLDLHRVNDGSQTLYSTIEPQRGERMGLEPLAGDAADWRRAAVALAAGCGHCPLGCQQPRPEGCMHPCNSPCHPGLCAPCGSLVPQQCHCGSLTLQLACSVWTKASASEQSKLRECGHR